MHLSLFLSLSLYISIYILHLSIYTVCICLYLCLILIGTTHAAHHIDCTIPHYHAQETTEAVRNLAYTRKLFLSLVVCAKNITILYTHALC